MLSPRERHFLAARRVGHLATADRDAVPHVVPVCYALGDTGLYITIDDKPKRNSARPLKRLRNIAENPAVAFSVDRYDEDWRRLGWVMLRGRARPGADTRCWRGARRGSAAAVRALPAASNHANRGAAGDCPADRTGNQLGQS